MSRTRTDEPTVRLVLTNESSGLAADEPPSRSRRAALLVVGGVVAAIAMAVVLVTGGGTRSRPGPSTVPTSPAPGCVDVNAIAADAFATDPAVYRSQVDAIRSHTGRTRRDEVLAELNSEREFVSGRIGSDPTGASSADAVRLAALTAAIAEIDHASAC